jgi:organic radical activating enzyme
MTDEVHKNPKPSSKTVREKGDELNLTSPSFCLAKWLQVTIHLQNGQTHSCHHPMTHKIPVEELKEDPSALHNTKFKKLRRKEMLEGVRPSECQYCWGIEDAHPDNLSDRHMKSSEDWAYPHMDEIKALPWDASVNPTYVEVSFGNECNFKCAYCAPHISSGIMQEIKKFGPYSTMKSFSEEGLRANNLYPISKDEYNPYVEAFWNWWPDLTKDLKVFRITGGEPLLNPNTFKFLEYIKANPMPNLTVAINSNLGVPQVTFQKFVKEVKFITENKLVKDFQLFTSVDTAGKNAEFIRFGLKYDEFMANVRFYLDELKGSELIFMCAYNAFSVLNFRTFLKEMIELKSNYYDHHRRTSRVILDIPYLREPRYLSCYVLTDDFIPVIRDDLKFMVDNRMTQDGKDLFFDTEISKLERILHWMESLVESDHRKYSRKELAIFLKEYCERKDINHIDYVPEYQDFIKYCESIS